MTSTSGSSAGARLTIATTVDHGRAELALTGEIDMSDADQLLMCIQWYLRTPEVTRVAVNLRHLSFMDAAGIRTLVLSRRTADELGKTLVIKDHHGHIAELIGILGLDKYLTEPDVPG